MKIKISKPLWGLRPILIYLLFSLFNFEAVASEIISKPPIYKSGKGQVLVFLPGARVPAENYQDLLKRIQQEVNVPLWTVTLKFIGDVPQPFRLKSRVKSILKKLSKKLGHEISAQDVWLSGHSLGGINAKRIAAEYGGLILLSSYFDRLGNREESDFPMFNKPVLLLSGELDGLTRAAYLARDAKFDTTNENLENWTRSVLLLPRVNHSLFAYDKKLLKGDIATKLNPSTGRKLIAKTVGSFMNIHSDQVQIQLKAEALKYLYEVKRESDALLSPYLSAYEMDRTLCGDAQDFIIRQDMGQNTPVEISSSTENQIANFALAKPSLKLDSDMEPVINTVKFVDKYRNIIDLGNISLAPKASFCKMKSAESVVDLSWLPEIFKKTSCSKIQKRLMLETLNLLSEDQYQRYLDSGKTLDFAKEKKHSTGIGWLSSRSELIDEEDGEYFVRSQSLYTSINAPKSFSGMTYCKFVTPARLLDWYLVDSLLQESN